MLIRRPSYLICGVLLGDFGNPFLASFRFAFLFSIGPMFRLDLRYVIVMTRFGVPLIEAFPLIVER